MAQVGFSPTYRRRELAFCALQWRRCAYFFRTCAIRSPTCSICLHTCAARGVTCSIGLSDGSGAIRATGIFGLIGGIGDIGLSFGAICSTRVIGPTIGTAAILGLIGGGFRKRFQGFLHHRKDILTVTGKGELSNTPYIQQFFPGKRHGPGYVGQYCMLNDVVIMHAPLFGLFLAPCLQLFSYGQPFHLPFRIHFRIVHRFWFGEAWHFICVVPPVIILFVIVIIGVFIFIPGSVHSPVEHLLGNSEKRNPCLRTQRRILFQLVNQFLKMNETVIWFWTLRTLENHLSVFQFVNL